jgi:hypothetical protein
MMVLSDESSNAVPDSVVSVTFPKTVKMMKARMMQSPELMESGKKYTRSLSFLLSEIGKA